MNIKKIKEWCSNAMDYAPHAIFLGVCASFCLVATMGLNEISNKDSYYLTYNETLPKYGDTNEDGIISPEEKIEFNSDFLRGRGVVRQETEGYYPAPMFLDGRTVPPKNLTAWLKEYDQEKSAAKK